MGNLRAADEAEKDEPQHVKEAAQNAGFNDLQNFYRQFIKDNMGWSDWKRSGNLTTYENNHKQEKILEREICGWDRFKNRRQVASYTGMCPREDTSDQRRFQGSINQHGNPRVRTALVAASWRLVQFQPTYKPVAKWLPALTHPKTTKSKRKQIVVAIGRPFSVD